MAVASLALLTSTSAGIALSADEANNPSITITTSVQEAEIGTPVTVLLRILVDGSPATGLASEISISSAHDLIVETPAEVEDGVYAAAATSWVAGRYVVTAFIAGVPTEHQASITFTNPVGYEDITVGSQSIATLLGRIWEILRIFLQRLIGLVHIFG